LDFDLVNVPERQGACIAYSLILSRSLNINSSRQPVAFSDGEETVLLHYGRPSLTGTVMEEKIFEFDRCSYNGVII